MICCIPGHNKMYRMKKIKGLMTLISLALIGRILMGIVISRTTMAISAKPEEFLRAFNGNFKSSVVQDRSSEYCNAPRQKINGLEGVPPSFNMMLLGTVVLVRHGDRLPISRPPAFKDIHVDYNKPCKLDPNLHPKHPMLHDYITNVTSYRELIRKNLNQAMVNFDVLPDTCSDVSITQTGIVQMLELGDFLGKRYMINDVKSLAISTSRFARTFQSLLSFLYGFSSSQFMDFVSGKISSSSSIYFCDSDSVLDPSFHNHCNCERAKQIAHLRSTFRDWDVSENSIAYLHNLLKIDQQRILATGQSLATFNKIGPPPLSVASPSRVWDWLVSEYYCPGRPLPCVNQECLNASLVEDLVHLVDKNHRRMISNYEYSKATSLAMYPFLKSINQKFHELVDEQRNRRIGGNSAKKPAFVWLLSGHDITIGPLFVALGIPLLKKVPYATRVAFELWIDCGDNQDCKSVYKPFVRILLNGKDVTYRMRCTTKDMHDYSHLHLCPLSYFNHFLESLFFRRFNSSDYNSACRL